jgi:hypothetical protein
MEPVEVLGLAGVAAAGWALGRSSRSRGDGSADPGERVAVMGAQVSRRAAFGVASVGSRALMLSAAGVSLAGSIAARGIGMGVDMAVSVGDNTTRLVRRDRGRGASDPHREVDLTTEEALQSTEVTPPGLEVPVDTTTTSP